VNHFWNFVRDSNPGEHVLYLDGQIAADSWFEDAVTPKAFREELFSGEGKITIWLNSYGGDVIAASQIYAMLIDYPHDVIIKIDGIAASAASVIAMAGTEVLMAPTALMVIHNPMTVAIGDAEEFQKAIVMLAACKEAILNAYEAKTLLSRTKLSHLMDLETPMNANQAVALGFADGIIVDEKRKRSETVGDAFRKMAVSNNLLDMILPNFTPIAETATKPKPISVTAAEPEPAAEPTPAPPGTPAESLSKRLSLISH
jgi:ATP-dependent Clp protease protease subunit